MYSMAFPNMFGSSYTNLVQDHEATYQNLKLLLLSDTTMLLGDPYYGTPLRKVIYAQNDYIIRDLVIDAIYTAIQTFMPQLILNRSDIQVTSDGDRIKVSIKATNLIDYTTNMYNISLTDTEKY